MRIGQTRSRVSRLGLKSAYHTGADCSYGEEHHPTYYHYKKFRNPFHLDYCFVPSKWLAGEFTASVGSFDDWSEVSDHRPIVVEIGPPRPARSLSKRAKLS